MWSFHALCDEFFVSTRLRLKLELSPSRETVLHFFEQIRRQHPQLARMRRREDGSLVLDQDQSDDSEGRRFLRLDPDMLKFGMCNPDDPQPLRDFSRSVLEQAPVHLSLSDLDYDNLEITFGFDLEYAGNHDELFAEALFGEHPLIGALAGDDRQVIDFQPYFGVALTDGCDLQAYVELKSRTSAYEVRNGEYEAAALSVYLTIRRYWNSRVAADLGSVHAEMLTVGEKLAAERVVPRLVRPLANAIASRR